jgi:phenylpyruvate tautomerase PptA (4-oxalocrotonate tautomerase family)
MAIVNLITTRAAISQNERQTLSSRLATLTYEAEGFAGSAVAPSICWTLFTEHAAGAFSTGAGEPTLPLYYIEITTLSGALDTTAKHNLGHAIATAILELEGSRDRQQPNDLSRVWVRFFDVPDGDLIVGGESTSLAGLRALVASQH